MQVYDVYFFLSFCSVISRLDCVLSDDGRMTETELNFFAEKLILIHAINDCCRFRIKSDKILV
jgi:hypothetical protein